MENSEGPELKVKYSVDLSGVKQGSAEVKKEVAAVASEAEKASKSGEKLAESLDDVKKESKELAPEVQKVTKEAKSMSESMDKASNTTKNYTPEVDKAGTSTRSLTDIMGKASAIAGGVFVTAAVAIAGAIASANSEVSDLDKSVRISSGSQENYATNMVTLENIADKYKSSIFSLAGSFNELVRETRGTINEGERTEVIFDTLTAVSKKLGVSVDDTTGSFTGFIDRMKQGTVDSAGLSNELDQRLYEAFTKVARGMGITNDELNEVLKTSDEAVSTILPQLAEQLSISLGDIPQKDAKDLGESIDYATGKMTLLLDSLFSTSGTKSFLAQAAEDAGDLMGQLSLLAKERGATGVVLGLMDAGAETLLSGTGFEGPSLSYARGKTQKGSMGNSFRLNGEIGNYINTPGSASGGYDIISAAEEIRLKEEEKASKKREAEAKRLASERKRALDEIARNEIAESNQRIKDQIFAMNMALEEAYGKNNGIVGPTPQLGKRGITTGYDNDLKKTQSFTNKTTGDGSALNFDRISNAIDVVISEAEAKYDQMQAAIANGMDDALMDLNESMGASMSNFASSFAIGIGETIGEALATGGDSLEDSGRKFGLMIAGLLSDLGKAMISFATLVIISESVISNPAAALAVGIAAVAAGAYLQSSLNKAEQKFFTGGFVTGPAGVDNVPIWASPGELVLNQGQQNNLLSAINGTMTAADYGGGNFGGGPSGGGKLTGRLTAELRSSTIAFAADIGTEDNNYFR